MADTLEANKSIMQRMIDDVWNKGDMTAAEELFAPDHTSPSAPDLPPGADGVKMLAGMFRAAMPDYSMSIDFMVAEGDKVVGRFTQSGTHTGDPLMGIPANGRAATWTETGILQVKDGRIVKSWYDVDMAGMMMQMHPEMTGG